MLKWFKSLYQSHKTVGSPTSTLASRVISSSSSHPPLPRSTLHAAAQHATSSMRHPGGANGPLQVRGEWRVVAVGRPGYHDPLALQPPVQPEVQQWVCHPKAASLVEAAAALFFSPKGCWCQSSDRAQAAAHVEAHAQLAGAGEEVVAGSPPESVKSFSLPECSAYTYWVFSFVFFLHTVPKKHQK